MAASETQEKRERAERILAAAATLLMRYGYNRVTMEDIARQAQVGKGTVYLHWKTKEALFGTLLLRELLGLIQGIIERLRTDPQEAMPHRLYASSMLDASRHPTSWALLTGDREVMGKLLAGAMGHALIARGIEYRAWLFRFWRENGLLESDTDPAAQLYAFRAIYSGFIQMESRTHRDPLSTEVKAEVFAQTIRRAFEPQDPPSPEVLRKVAATMAHSLEQFCQTVEREIDQHMQV